MVRGEGYGLRQDLSQRGDLRGVLFPSLKSPTLLHLLRTIHRVFSFWVVRLQGRERVSACSWLCSLAAINVLETKVELCLGLVEVFQVLAEYLAGTIKLELWNACLLYHNVIRFRASWCSSLAGASWLRVSSEKLV